MADLSEAYDFSLFEDRVEGSAVPARDPQRREEKRQRDNVIDLPEEELKKNRRPKRHPLRAMAIAVCFSLIFGSVLSIVYNQVRLTELTEEINSTTEDLNEAKSLEVQLSMQASEKMNGSQVEEYAKKQLGMSKISNGQVSYVNVVQEDKGAVIQDTGDSSLLESILAKIRSWFV